MKLDDLSTEQRDKAKAVLVLMANTLTERAAELGLNLTIEQRPKQPLAMGNNEYMYTVWEKRK